MLPSLGGLEKFLHDEPERIPLLIKAALAHVQFESIHPFLDGNGRVGRLLITFLLCAGGALREPLLYLSLYLEKHRARYYELLQEVRMEGDWEAWLAFFLTGVRETADQAAATAHALMKLAANDAEKVQGLKRAAGSALRVQGYLQRRPLTTIAACSKSLRLSVPAVTTAFENLQALGLVNEVTGRKRNRYFVYHAYLELLNAETEPA